MAASPACIIATMTDAKLHELAHVIAGADRAINEEDFDALMDFYAEDATLVVMPGRNVTGKDAIRKAFVAIAEHFDHSLEVTQHELQVIEGGDTALVLARTRVAATMKTGERHDVERRATYVFRRSAAGTWRCLIDNSYGTDLLAPVGS
jgi:uncharacterized protein (TIGR02246 family)